MHNRRPRRTFLHKKRVPDGLLGALSTDPYRKHGGAAVLRIIGWKKGIFFFFVTVSDGLLGGALYDHAFWPGNDKMGDPFKDFSLWHYASLGLQSRAARDYSWGSPAGALIPARVQMMNVVRITPGLWGGYHGKGKQGISASFGAGDLGTG